MSRINCHSGFQHYEMFHSRHCGGGNYGSIFNTTYNIKCGGSHTGGFWGGFGIGLGNAFGGWLGGILGGGNMFSGNMFSGIPMFGGGMFSGFPSWNNSWNLSGLFGNREKKADKSDESDKSSKPDSNSKTAECKDPDLAKINDFRDSIQALQKAPDAAKAEALKKEIEKAKANQDDTHKAENTAAYDNLLEDLDKLINKPAKAPAQNEAATGPVSQVVSKQEVVAPASDDNANKIANANSFDTLPDYATLSDANKKKYLDKCLELANSLSPKELQAQISKLPDEVRAKVKQSFYENGYTNVEPEKLTDDLLRKLVTIIDKSEIDDFDNISIQSTKKSADNKWTVEIKSNESGTKVSYVQVEVVDGELIFHGRQDNQKYVLQKDQNNKLHLMQYKYHEGYGIADVKKNA